MLTIIQDALTYTVAHWQVIVLILTSFCSVMSGILTLVGAIGPAKIFGTFGAVDFTRIKQWIVALLAFISIQREMAKKLAKTSMLFVILLLCGCAGTLEESRATVRMRSIAGIRVTRDAELCDSLSSKQFWALVVTATCGAASAASGGVLAWQSDPSPTEKKALAYAAGFAGLCAVGGGVAVQWLSAEWIRKECSQ